MLDAPHRLLSAGTSACSATASPRRRFVEIAARDERAHVRVVREDVVTHELRKQVHEVAERESRGGCWRGVCGKKKTYYVLHSPSDIFIAQCRRSELAQIRSVGVEEVEEDVLEDGNRSGSGRS